VDLEIVEMAVPHLAAQVAAMVRLQMRSGEVVAMRAGDIDRSGPVWLYRPAGHKMAYRDRGRVIPLGPQAQLVLTPFLEGRPTEVYLFDPPKG
jgi:integrase